MIRRLLIVFFVAITCQTLAAESQAIAIIVNKTNKMQAPDSGELSLIFMRKKLYFSDGMRIAPVNLPSNHMIRKSFSAYILGSLPEAQAAYWNEAYYHGITPPYVVGSQESAIRFVEVTQNAIAYIDACKLTETVKAVAWVDLEKGVLTHPPELNCPE